MSIHWICSVTKKNYCRQNRGRPWEKISGILEVPKGIDQGTIIPVSIINGKKPGPVLTLIAGMHGTEYVPIITLQRIYQYWIQMNLRSNNYSPYSQSCFI